MLVNPKPSLQATAALAANLRVKLSSGKLVVAVATDKELGTLDGAALAADDMVAVLPRNVPGARKYVAGAAIAKHADVYSAAGGKISSTQATGAFYIGVALEAASGDESIIPVFANPDGVPKAP